MVNKMRRQQFILELKPWLDGFKMWHKCAKCNYGSFEQWKILGHLASNHLPAKKKSKAKLCKSCGLSVGQCTLNGVCPRENPQQPTGSQRKLAKNFMLDIHKKPTI